MSACSCLRVAVYLALSPFFNRRARSRFFAAATCFFTRYLISSGLKDGFLGDGFSKISRFLERIQVEHIESKSSLESQLQICSICSIRIRSKNRDIVGKLFKTLGFSKISRFLERILTEYIEPIRSLESQL